RWKVKLLHLWLCRATPGAISPARRPWNRRAIGSTKLALRDEPWLAASYSADGLSMPFEAVTSDDAAPVVVDVSESVGLSSGLFDEHVGVLGSAVGGSAGAVVGEDQL